jgi:hypothetical protein
MISAMGGEPARMMIPGDDLVAAALLLAVRGGDLDTIGRLLAEHSGLARARFVARDGGTRTSLHLVADWPGSSPTALRSSSC